MLKIVKGAILTVSAGLVVGVSVIVWLRANPAFPRAASSSGGGSVVLGASSTPQPASASSEDLHVSSPSSVAAAGGSANTLLGGNSSTNVSSATPNSSSNTATASSSDGSANQASPTPTSSVPSPADFAQYNKYSDCTAYPTALFGDEVVGKGAQVVAGTTLNVLYRGWLTNGVSFDASTDPTKPFVFREGDHAVIQGWEQGLLGMKVGGIRRLIIPPCVGYGAAGHPPIPPNAVLIFDVQLTAAQ
jgi:FKBP-type peptidyl-prolyl cis-trans isomerase FkpA